MIFSEIIFIINAFILIIIATIGLIGSIKENQRLTLIFGAIMALFTIVDFANLMIFSAAIGLIVTILAFVFAYLIGKEVRPTENYV